MDLYGTGASVGQANSLSAEVRNANLGVESVNSDLAEKLDTAKQEESQTSLENQAINMYQGGQALTSFVGNPEVQAAAEKLKSRGVQAAGKFLPVSGPERFARGGIEGFEGGQFAARQALRAAEDRTGTAGVFAGPELFDAAREEASQFGGEVTDIGGGAERASLGLGSGAETAATAIGGDPRFGLDDTIPEASERFGLDDTVETAFDRRAGIQTTADIADETGATTEGERALASGGEAAEDVGRGIQTSADVVKTGAKEALGTFARGAAAGLGGALDIYKDVERGSIGDNWEQQVGNVGNIVGSGLEVLGLATAWTGPLGIGLEALGAGISLGSTAFETYGDVKAGEETDKQTTSDIESERQSAVSSQTIEKAVGRAES
jgi:hypothetical protein